jgi:hypothetical protein
MGFKFKTAIICTKSFTKEASCNRAHDPKGAGYTAGGAMHESCVQAERNNASAGCLLSTASLPYTALQTANTVYLHVRNLGSGLFAEKPGRGLANWCSFVNFFSLANAVNQKNSSLVHDFRKWIVP